MPLNFAYGSNMLLARIRERVPAAKPLGMAVLPQHVLKWHKIGQDHSGKCDIVATATCDACVYGVLYEIPAAQQAFLDRAEGLGHGYEQKQVVVQQGSEMVQASAYFATQISDQMQPFTWYQALVVAGAIENGLPAEYIDLLRAAAAVRDANEDRHRQHLSLIKLHLR